MESLIDDRAIIDDEDEESYDEETGEVRHKTNGANGHFEDSSEEDDDDDDEEAAAEVAKGFIVDEDEEDTEARRERRRQRKKRRREDHEDEGLDEEDLELIGMKPADEVPEPKFKRLKRGPREDRDAQRPAGVNDIFASEDEEDAPEAVRRPRNDGRALQDEFDDFIEEDVFSDDEQQRQQEDEEVARPTRRGLPDLGIADAAGLDEQALEDFRAAFGDGTDYDFALEKEEEADEEQAEKDKRLNMNDIFEPSQMAEKLLTDADKVIRLKDEPERHQLARKPYEHFQLTEDQFKEEALWISKLMLPKKKDFRPELAEPFRRAIAQVLEFLIRDELEVPFIFQNRKDYLIHVTQKIVGRDADGTPRTAPDADRMLIQRDLWDIFEHDLKFRALIDKRQALQKTYSDLQSTNVAPDATFEELLPLAVTMEELQDLQDYIYFQYAAQLKDLALTSTGDTTGAAMSQKKASTTTVYEEIRSSKAYSLVRAFGISADAFSRNASRQGVRTYAEDPTDSPEDLADTVIDEEFSTGSKALKAARAMFTEELVMSPRFRKVARQNVYLNGVVDCHRTEKGLRKIDEQHPYYEFKYLRNQDFGSIAGRPELYLKMLKAEDEGLVDVKVRLQHHDALKKQLNKHIETDNYSNVADAWNRERRNVVSAALDKLVGIIGRVAKENLKNECENVIGNNCREEFNRKLDQAPYQPRGMKKGTTPRVLTMSNGNGVPGRDAVCWAYTADDGRVLETGKFVELAPGDRERGLPDGKDVDAFLEVVHRREPEVIGISGFTPETRKLHSHISTLVRNHDLRGPTFSDEDDRDRSDFLEVLIVNDEVARMYQSSERAKSDHPGLPPLTHYCVALGRYVQDPMKEYAALGRDIISISFDPAQHFLPQDKLLKKLEMALVDNVNMVGVDLNDISGNSSVANLLPYVSGLGPRKAAHLVQVINLNGGFANSREELLGLNEGNQNNHAAMAFKVWSNAAGTLYVSFDPSEPSSEYLDNTRIHPEDYDIARKMAADALELDEEDIEAERQEFGQGAIVRRLIKEEAQERVNDLVLEEYAEQLEKNLNSKKRATLENIRAELIEPYEELRNPFLTELGESEVFTMFTGETKDSLQKGMNVPVTLKRISDSYVEGFLDCGIVAVVEESAWTEAGVSPKQIFTMHQTVLANISSINRREFTVSVSLREDQVKQPFKRYNREGERSLNYDEWDDREEVADKKLLEEKTDSGMRATRVIKHPLFRALNAKSAEEYLGSQNRGDVVIRPSSKGTDHLAVTWKVADGIFQHIDVLELDKENEFALGKTLRIGGRYNYSDLDELIVLHVKAMARKVDEMCGNEKFQDKTKAQLEEWLTTYTNANPKRSMYQFCINRDRPGQFHLCFKAGQKAKLMDWTVRVIPAGFELMKQPYPTMRDLCNGFKLLFANMQTAGTINMGRR